MDVVVKAITDPRVVVVVILTVIECGSDPLLQRLMPGKDEKRLNIECRILIPIIGALLALELWLVFSMDTR